MEFSVMSIDSSSTVVSAKPKMEEENKRTPFRTEVKKSSSSSATNWYEGDDISRLLKHLVGHCTDIEIFAPINIEQSDTLRINLWDEQIQQALSISKGAALASTYVLPINLGNRHWAALYLHFPTANRLKPHVSYFDPYGTPSMPAELVQALSAIYTDLKPEDFFVCPLQLQRDTYNCGPWVVAIFESLLTTKLFPEEGLDIQRKRAEYDLILQGRTGQEGVEKKEENKKDEKQFYSPRLFGTVKPEKISIILAKQQLMALLAEAKTCQKESGYKHQIKAAFYYQAALVFCDKELIELAEVGKSKVKTPEKKENKSEGAASLLESDKSTPSKDLIRFYIDEKEKIIQALAILESTYPQKALEITAHPKFESKRNTDAEHKASVVTMAPENILAYLKDNPYKKTLKGIREKAKADLEIYHGQTAATIDEDKKSETKDKYKLTMREIYLKITDQMKALVAEMFDHCITENKSLLGDPPCDYAIIGFGSLARKVMTPYSDIEFAILIRETKDKQKHELNKHYFRNLTKLFFLKMINLGETTFKIMDISLPNCIKADFIRNGFSFDGQAKPGRKTPLGNQAFKDIAKDEKFELIGTPDELMVYVSDAWFEKNMHLASVLTCFDLIKGNNSLLNEYKAKIRKFLEQPIQTGNMEIRSRVRATRILYPDMERFEPKMGKLTDHGRNYSIKYEIYRPLDTILDALALFNGFNFDEGGTWEKLDNLIKKSFINEHNGNLTNNKLLEPINYLRLKTYLEYDEQKDDYFSDSGDKYENISPEIIEIYKYLYPLHDAAGQLISSGFASKNFKYNPFKKDIFPNDKIAFSLIDAEICSDLSNDDRAMEIYENLLKEELSILDQVRTISRIALCHARLKDFDRAIKKLNEADEIISKSNLKDDFECNKLQINLYINKASIEEENGNYESAKEYYSKANLLLNHMKKSEQRLRNPFELGVLDMQLTYDSALFYQKVGNHLEAVILFEDLIAAATSNGNTNQLPKIARYKLSASYSYEYLGDFDWAIEYASQSIEQNKQFFGNCHYFVAGGYHNMGFVLAMRGSRQEAIHAYKQALEIYKKNNWENSSDFSSTMVNYISEVSNTDNPEILLNNLKETENILSILENCFSNSYHPYIVNALNCRAAICSRLMHVYKDKNKKKEYRDKAFEIHDKAIKIISTYKDDSLYIVAATYSSYALFLATNDVGDYKQAIKLMFKSLKISKRLCDSDFKTVCDPKYAKYVHFFKNSHLVNKVFDSFSHIGNFYKKLAKFVPTDAESQKAREMALTTFEGLIFWSNNMGSKGKSLGSIKTLCAKLEQDISYHKKLGR